MALFESLLGLLVGGTAAAAGAGINHNKKKKRWDAYRASEDTKLQEQVNAAQQLRDAEDAETKAFRRELESWIGGRLEEDQKHRRYYNLPLEFELACKNLDEMFQKFQKANPPCTEVKIAEIKRTCSWNRTFNQADWHFYPVYHVEVLPSDPAAYLTAVKRAFWRRVLDKYNGPDVIADRPCVRTYYVDPGTYALGHARKQIIRDGFLPSNCRDHLWINWSPYVQWTGEHWNCEFNSGHMDLAPRFALFWLTPDSIPNPHFGENVITDYQKTYEKKYPDHFQNGGSR